MKRNRNDPARKPGFCRRSALRSEERKSILIWIVSEVPTSAAAVFLPIRKYKAPHSLQGKIQAGTLQGVIVNAGNANACTGSKV